MKLFILIYNSLIWGLVAAILATYSLWLDMRIKVDLIIPAVLLITLLVGLFSKSNLTRTAKFALANLIVCFLIAYVVLGAKRLAVLPASIIRETIHMTNMSFSMINWGLLILFTLGLIVIWIWRPKTVY